MALGVVDAEGQTRVLSFGVAPGNTEKGWLELFSKTRGV